MDSMPISKFKATCLATLERVRRTGRPLRVTRFGKPVADVVPAAATPTTHAWLGDLRDTLEIVGDLVAPASSESEWDVLR
jgi:prevent-host-death family protein